mgnify:CR=1 FL=1
MGEMPVTCIWFLLVQVWLGMWPARMECGYQSPPCLTFDSLAFAFHTSSPPVGGPAEVGSGQVLP